MSHKTRLFSTLIVLTTLIVVSVAHAQERVYDRIPYNCESTEAEFYAPDQFPRYEFEDQQLVLVDWTTGVTINTIETSLETPGFEATSWSPNCRYLSAALGERGGTTTTVIWDVVAGERIGSFPEAREWPHRLYWNPDSTQVVVQADDGAFLWNLQTDERALLVDHSTTDDYWLRLRWDNAARELFLLKETFGYTDTAVRKFDLRTGQETGAFGLAHETSDNISFSFSRDDGQLIVFSRFGAPGAANITLWDRETGADIQVNAGSDASGVIDLSPEHRFLAVGAENIRIWDLSARADDLQVHAPLYQYSGPQGGVWNLRFIDENTLETTSIDGTQRWDVLTGELVG